VSPDRTERLARRILRAGAPIRRCGAGFAVFPRDDRRRRPLVTFDAADRRALTARGFRFAGEGGPAATPAPVRGASLTPVGMRLAAELGSSRAPDGQAAFAPALTARALWLLALAEDEEAVDRVLRKVAPSEAAVLRDAVLDGGRLASIDASRGWSPGEAARRLAGALARLAL